MGLFSLLPFEAVSCFSVALPRDVHVDCPGGMVAEQALCGDVRVTSCALQALSSKGFIQSL